MKPFLRALLAASVWAAPLAAAPIKLLAPAAPLATRPPAASALILPGRFQAPAGALCPLPVSPIAVDLQAVPVVPAASAQTAVFQLDQAAAGLEKKPEAALSGLYDGPLDGTPVSPRIYMADEALAAEAEQQRYLAVLRPAVARAYPRLARSVARDDWNGPGTTLDTPCCGDAAPKLAYLLRREGHPAHVVEAELHYYVAVELARGRLVVDPTIRQFFGGEKAPKEIPAIFVGTDSELFALFERHRASRTSKFPFSRIYFSEAKTADAKMSGVAERLGLDSAN